MTHIECALTAVCRQGSRRLRPHLIPPPVRALMKLTVRALELAWHEPVGPVLGIGIPIIPLLIFGLISRL